MKTLYVLIVAAVLIISLSIIITKGLFFKEKREVLTTTTTLSTEKEVLNQTLPDVPLALVDVIDTYCTSNQISITLKNDGTEDSGLVSIKVFSPSGENACSNTLTIENITADNFVTINCNRIPNQGAGFYKIYVTYQSYNFNNILKTYNTSAHVYCYI